jgi:hypothetical protein
VDLEIPRHGSSVIACILEALCRATYGRPRQESWPQMHSYLLEGVRGCASVPVVRESFWDITEFAG